MKHARSIAHAVIIAAVLLLPRFVYSQNLPPWVNDGWRQTQYPPNVWYVGFAMDGVGRGTNVADVTRNVANQARAELAGQITVNIQSETVLTTTSDRTTQADGRAQENIRRDYGQMIATSTNTEVGGIEVVTHHDAGNNIVYALATVRKSDLAAYYQSRIDFHQRNAEDALRLAQQLAEQGRRRSASETLDAIPAQLNECARYITLLSAVVGDVSSQQERGTALVSQVNAFQTRLVESFTVYVTGTETVDGRNVSVVIPGLQQKFNENGCRIATDRTSAGYVLTVNVTEHNVSQDRNFTYCQARVNAELFNTQAGRSENRINFNGQREGWRTKDRACGRAFERAVDRMWTEISTNTEICR